PVVTTSPARRRPRSQTSAGTGPPRAVVALTDRGLGPTSAPISQPSVSEISLEDGMVVAAKRAVISWDRTISITRLGSEAGLARQHRVDRFRARRLHRRNRHVRVAGPDHSRCVH